MPGPDDLCFPPVCARASGVYHPWTDGRAVLYLLELESPFVTPVMEAMQTVSSICVVMLGSLPAALFLQRLLRVPLKKAGRLLRLDEAAVAAILIGTVSVLPALAMLKDMTPAAGQPYPPIW